MDSKAPRQETAHQKCAPNGYWIPSGSIESVNDAYHCCENFVQSVGYDYFFFVMYVPLTPRRKVEIVSTNYPLEWRRRYEARGYMAIDPIARAVVTWSRPFTWRSVQIGCDEKAQAFWEDARQHGLHDGLVIPLRCAAGGRAYLVMAGQSIPDDLAAVKMHLGAATVSHPSRLGVRFGLAAGRIGQRHATPPIHSFGGISIACAMRCPQKCPHLGAYSTGSHWNGSYAAPTKNPSITRGYRASSEFLGSIYGVPTGIRTPVLTVKG